MSSKEPSIIEIREALAARDALEGAVGEEVDLSHFDPWVALQRCVDELDARAGDAQLAEVMAGEMIVKLDGGTSPLIRLAALRMQLPGIYAIAHSLTLDELREFKPHTQRMVLLLEGTLDHYYTEEKREGRSP